MGKPLNPEAHLPNNQSENLKTREELQKEFDDLNALGFQRDAQQQSDWNRKRIELRDFKDAAPAPEEAEEPLKSEEIKKEPEGLAGLVGEVPVPAKKLVDKDTLRERDLEKKVSDYTLDSRKNGLGARGGIQGFFKAQRELNALKEARAKKEAETPESVAREKIKVQMGELLGRSFDLEDLGARRTPAQEEELAGINESLAELRRERAALNEKVAKVEVVSQEEEKESQEESDEEFIKQWAWEDRRSRDERIANIEKELGSMDQLVLWRTAGRLKEELLNLRKDNEKAEALEKQEREPGEIQALRVIEAQSQKIEEKAKSLGEQVLEKVKDAGKWYAAIPFWKKMVVSATLFGASYGAGVVGGSLGAAILGVTGVAQGMQRVLSGTATYVALEAVLQNDINKSLGRERTWPEALRHNALAATSGLIVGSGVAGEALMKGFLAAQEFVDGFFASPAEIALASANGLAGAGAETVLAEGAAKGAKEAIKAKVEAAATSPVNININLGEGATPPAPAIPLAPESTLVERGFEAAGEAVAQSKPLEGAQALFTVKEGNTLWELMKKGLGSMVEGKTPEEQSAIVDGLYKKIAGLSESTIKSLGIMSGDIDTIQIGEKIDLTKLYEGQFDVPGEPTIADIVEGGKEGASSFSTPPPVEKVVSVKGFVGDTSPDVNSAAAEIEKIRGEALRAMEKGGADLTTAEKIARNTARNFVNNRK